LSYAIVVSPTARRDLKSLPSNVFERISQAIDNLQENPRLPGARKMKGKPHWRVRVGNYRIVYLIDDDNQQIVLAGVGHRKDIYRR
jgi:mRNA interferase RelE/StbE